MILIVDSKRQYRFGLLSQVKANKDRAGFMRNLLRSRIEGASNPMITELQYRRSY